MPFVAVASCMRIPRTMFLPPLYLYHQFILGPQSVRLPQLYQINHLVW